MRPIKNRTSTTSTTTKAKQITCRIFDSRFMNWVSQVLRGAVNLNASQAPANMDTMLTICSINPFRIPCTKAGMKQIKSIMSNMPICLIKNAEFLIFANSIASTKLEKKL